MVGRVSGQNLQIKGGGSVSWLGSGGARLGGMRDLLVSSLRRRRAPTTVILHFGTNDLLEISSYDICELVTESLSSIRRLFPNTRIIWSDILPRSYYHKEDNVGAGYMVKVNRHAHTVCMNLKNVCFVKHGHNFHPGDPSFKSLYIWDGTHLSPEGKRLLVQDWTDGLCFLNENPSEVGFPPLR